MADYRRSSSEEKRRRRRRAIAMRVLLMAALAVVFVGAFFGIRAAYRGIRGWVDSVMNDPMLESSSRMASSTEKESASVSTTQAEEAFAHVIEEARGLAKGYDYEGAMALIKAQPEYAKSSVLQKAYQDFLRETTTLVKVDITQVYHVFFHSLIVDTELAFSSDEKDGYNQVMTTVDEFNKMMEQMYEKGFVLVGLHQMAYLNENGEFVKGSLMLPPGKKPFVLSVDDVQYYEYMTGDGFATKILLDADGSPTCEYKMRDGSVVTGDYDVVPLLEKFVREHPDFSYRGAKGCLALTGYEGILGYRTAPMYGNPADPDYKPAYASINVEKEREEAKKVAARLKELGWEFASHSWGHINMKNAGPGWITTDMNKWKDEVDSLLGGDTDILIFAFGVDFGSWRPYTTEDEKYKLLKSMGFRYFCPVDSYNIPWVQFSASEGFLRQGRVNLDGYEMYYRADKLDIFFDTESVFDKSRPLPVPSY